ncbi:type II toxin-antitoxin system RelE/ParE family toxin [Bosea sp. (in: a-proteobacteria)]|uniref:type II toxin-antitoxin system RelE/ParE family toxin n=1 Tax=Bosea sp. (in: a-proteobacteria) TaxID=1871050 RepID=UPI0025C2EAB6|nr:type II toxin-antitoxin system RelE/ParE family toxin [Bosea sp. (in: a-proteobacteria)]
MNAVVQSEADALPDDIRARLFRYAGVIEDEGLNALPAGWVKPLGDKLWELRLTGRDGIARAIYVTATGKRVVIVRFSSRRPRKRRPRNFG